MEMEMNKVIDRQIYKEVSEMNEAVGTVRSVGCEVGIDSTVLLPKPEEMSPELESALEITEEQAIEVPDSKKVVPFELAMSRGSTRASKQKGVFSIVNALKRGKRISISNEVHDMIGAPASIQVAFRGNSLILSKQLSPNKKESGYFLLKPQGKSQMCYCTELVREISKRYSLDFSDRVSITFYDVEYETIDKNLAAVIKIA